MSILDNLYTVEKYAEKFPHVTTEALRWYIRHRYTNGFAPVCFKVGRKLLIHHTRFEEWQLERDAYRQGAGTGATTGALAIAPVCGVYFLIDASGEVVYVGQSIDVHVRVAQHRRERVKQFATCKCIPCPRYRLDELEQHHIRALDPRYNIVGAMRA